MYTLKEFANYCRAMNPQLSLKQIREDWKILSREGVFNDFGSCPLDGVKRFRARGMVRDGLVYEVFTPDGDYQLWAYPLSPHPTRAWEINMAPPKQPWSIVA